MASMDRAFVLEKTFDWPRFIQIVVFFHWEWLSPITNFKVDLNVAILEYKMHLKKQIGKEDNTVKQLF